MTCSHHLANGPLVCTLPDGHRYGHVYESTTVADGRHDDEGGDW